MRISESRLRHVIRRVILEGSNYAKYMSANIDSRIKKQINKMIDESICMYVEDNDDELIISLYKVDWRELSKYRNTNGWIKYKSERNELQKEPEAQELVGSVTFVKYLNSFNQNFPRNRAGVDPVGIKIGGSKRKKAWHVIDSRVVDAHRHLGLGPIMYEAGIEYISRHKNCAVMSDVGPSDHAYNVWEKFNNRSDFEKYQFDTDIVSRESIDYWTESPMTKGFFNNLGRVIKELFKQKLIFKI